MNTIQYIKSAFTPNKVSKAFKTLSKNPNNQEANEIVNTYVDYMAQQVNVVNSYQNGYYPLMSQINQRNEMLDKLNRLLSKSK